MLSSWINQDSHKVLSNLKRDGDYYMLKKNTVQSWFGIFRNGPQAIRNRFNLSWMRMGAMDISDIGYDAFLVNGKQQNYLSAEPGQQVRLRIINSAAASYFDLAFAGGTMKIVALDGVDVEPFTVDRFFIAIAETYDVIVTIPDDRRSYELRASSEDGTGYSSLFLGQGDPVYASAYPRPNLYLRKFKHHGMHGKKKDHKKDSKKLMHHMQGHTKDHKSMQQRKKEMHKVKDTMHHKQHDMKKHEQKDIHDPQLNYYKGIRSLIPTKFSEQYPVRELELRLTGNMERYLWGINNRPLSEVDKILVRKGEVIRFKMINEMMMHHPMHLHGHFFRVLNDQGEYSPLKHTVSVPPMDELTIEFLASEDKDWFFHCHNLYHMMSGFSRIISYGDSGECKKNLWSHLTFDRGLFFYNDHSFASNMMFGFAQVWNTRNRLFLEYDFNYKNLFEVDALYYRNFARYVDVYVGGNFERHCPDESIEKLAVAGIRFVLPLWVVLDVRVDHKAHVFAEFHSELQLTKRLKFEWEANTDKEYRTAFSLEITKEIVPFLVFDSDFRFGGGLRIRCSW